MTDKERYLSVCGKIVNSKEHTKTFIRGMAFLCTLPFALLYLYMIDFCEWIYNWIKDLCFYVYFLIKIHT